MMQPGTSYVIPLPDCKFINMSIVNQSKSADKMRQRVQSHRALLSACNITRVLRQLFVLLHVHPRALHEAIYETSRELAWALRLLYEL